MIHVLITTTFQDSNVGGSAAVSTVLVPCSTFQEADIVRDQVHKFQSPGAGVVQSAQVLGCLDTGR